MTEKRPRGRPPGEGKKDGIHLAKIADIMIARKLKKPTTAMKAYIAQQGNVWSETDSTLIRRWQEKWKVQGEAHLQTAEKRAEPVRVSNKASATTHAPYNDIVNCAMRRNLDLINRTSAWEKLLQPSPLQKMIEQGSKTFEMLERGAMSKTLKAAMGIIDSPVHHELDRQMEIYKRLNLLP